MEGSLRAFPGSSGTGWRPASLRTCQINLPETRCCPWLPLSHPQQIYLSELETGLIPCQVSLSGNNTVVPSAWGWEVTGSSGVPPELGAGALGRGPPCHPPARPSRPGPKVWGISCEVPRSASCLGRQVCTSQHLAYLVARAACGRETGRSWKSLQLKIQKLQQPSG